jgi:hypothetical protein
MAELEEMKKTTHQGHRAFGAKPDIVAASVIFKA